MKVLSTLLALVAIASSATAGSLYDVPVKDIDGKETTLKPYEGKVMLIVNVASKCGNTKQYTELQALHKEFEKEGLAILGFPSNDFGGQEPGTNEEIKEFCSSKYKVSFPLYDKVVVKGENKHPLYQQLSGPESPFPGDVKWNFGKFLVGRDGKIIARFEPKVKPDDVAVTTAIKEALAKK
ncbi:glutathione peroxidase [Prosthecobacter dejongeii]|uniref:Glutathione peroxidase n=1 Tax=Prosthecobacter dejongeii TaxID=48465 RepID=A0A7W7YQC9_9BACT|nr:glutathione peroxidase [Prosthecobacter dejongeii]MBB5040433.1 glutathione peroxidase [Prosthecobacter dejongeii]